MLPDCKVEDDKKDTQPTKAQTLNKQVMEALQGTHYTLGSLLSNTQVNLTENIRKPFERFKFKWSAPWMA